MSFGKKVVASLAVAVVVALSLLAASGVMTATASPGPIRVHIDTGVVVVGHTGGCFVQEGNVEAEAPTGFSPPAPASVPAIGRFVANLKVLGTDPTSPNKPCGTIRGAVNFEAHPHFAGLFGNWSGVVTEHSGPTPIGSFVGALVTGNWQIRHVARQGAGVTVGEGNLNVSLF